MKIFELYNYQQEYFNYVTSKNKNIFMYEMDTGTGKTIMALFHYKYFYPNNKLIIVAPASKLKEGGWQRTINEFDNAIEYDTCSYNMLNKRYKEFENMFIVFDECHRLKNSTGVWRKGWLQFNQNSNWIYPVKCNTTSKWMGG